MNTAGMMSPFTVFVFFWEIFLVQGADQCVNHQGRVISSGQHFIPSILRPCVECLCLSGMGVRCGPPLCLGRVNCSQSWWNSTVCCKEECFELRTPSSRVLSGDLTARNRDYQVPFWNSHLESDDKDQRSNEEMFTAYTPDYNVTSASVPGRSQSNLPSPYYPILIGLISCAPVALCIICVNAIRKYFALRSQFPGGSIFPRRLRRRPVATETSNEATTTEPTVFTSPPPDYKDLTNLKLCSSEDLPRYEDVMKHDSNNNKIFATTSSAEFLPPERINLAFSFSVVDETAQQVFPDANPHPIPLTAAPPSRPRPSASNEGIDNPAHDAHDQITNV